MCDELYIFLDKKPIKPLQIIRTHAVSLGFALSGLLTNKFAAARSNQIPTSRCRYYLKEINIKNKVSSRRHDGMTKCRDGETSRHRDDEASRHWGFETSRLRDIETSRHRDIEASRHRDDRLTTKS